MRYPFSVYTLLAALAMAAPHLATPGTPIVIRASDGRQVSARVVRTPFLEVK